MPMIAAEHVVARDIVRFADATLPDFLVSTSQPRRNAIHGPSEQYWFISLDRTVYQIALPAGVFIASRDYPQAGRGLEIRRGVLLDIVTMSPRRETVHAVGSR